MNNRRIIDKHAGWLMDKRISKSIFQNTEQKRVPKTEDKFVYVEKRKKLKIQCTLSSVKLTFIPGIDCSAV